MMYAFAALAIIIVLAAIAATIACITFAGQRNAARMELERVKLEAKGMAQANATADDTRKRLEAVIEQLKAHLSEMEKSLEACSDPTVVRDRLRSLLSSATSPSSTTDGVPPGPSPAKP